MPDSDLAWESVGSVETVPLVLRRARRGLSNASAEAESSVDLYSCKLLPDEALPGTATEFSALVLQGPSFGLYSGHVALAPNLET